MKKIFYITSSIAFSLLLALMFGCKPDNPEAETGNIYGVVTVKSTAEPMRATGVELNIKRETYPYSWDLVTKTVTYDDGHFEFNNLPIMHTDDQGKAVKARYLISVDAAGYRSVEKEVVLLAGQTSRMDMQLEEQYTYLTVRTLEATPAGNQVELKGTVSCSNSEYKVEEVGFLYAKSTETININGTRVTADLDETNFSIVVNNLEKGTYQVQAYAKNYWGTSLGERQVFTIRCYPSIQTLEASNINDESASLNARVIYEGEPAYTERGFVYSSKFENPSVDDDASTTRKVVVSGRSTEFSANITNLSKGETYYARAYLTNSDGTFYGAPIKFKASSALEDVIVLDELKLMVQKNDIPGGVFTWTEAKSRCEASRVAGFSDWRMPTKGELLAICENGNVSGFSSEYYWTITVRESGNPYMVWMGDCSVSYNPKTYSYKVRAVRTITE